jgi:hypothetical protein
MVRGGILVSRTSRLYYKVIINHIHDGSQIAALIASDLVKRLGPCVPLSASLITFSRVFRSRVCLSGPKTMPLVKSTLQKCSTSPSLSIGYRIMCAFYRGRKLWAVAGGGSWARTQGPRRGRAGLGGAVRRPTKEI